MSGVFMEDELVNLDDYKVDLEKPALEEKPTLAKTKDLIEVIGKFTIGIVALCYALGLLVVNLYLSRYGVYSLSLFRLNYIMAGIWVLSPYFIAFLILSITLGFSYSIPPIRIRIHRYFNLPLKETRSGLTGCGIFAFLFIFIISINVTIQIIKSLNIVYDNHWFPAIIVPTMYSLFGVIAIRYIRTRLSSAFQLPAFYGCLLIAIAIFISQTYEFSKNLYGTIPPHLGGGGTKDVQLLLKLEDNDRQFFELAGVQFYTEYNRTQTLQLLFANDDEYVFLVKPTQFPDAKGSTLSIKKDLVQGVIYQGVQGSQDPNF
jgi:hypothetical protein